LFSLRRDSSGDVKTDGIEELADVVGDLLIEAIQLGNVFYAEVSNRRRRVVGGRRSIEECRYYLILAKDLNYGDTSRLNTLLAEVSRMLNAYATAILMSG
jgi:hypothetical protein